MLGKDTVLIGNIKINEALKKQTNYYLYSATLLDTGDEVLVTEYYPPNASRGEDGSIIAAAEEADFVDMWINNMITSYDIISNLELNKYLGIRTSFPEGGTGYYVSDKITGATLKEYLETIRRPFKLDEAAPLFLDLLKSIVEAANKNIYFHLTFDSVYFTTHDTLRMYCYYEYSYSEKSAMTDMINLFYFMLTCSAVDSDEVKINTEHLSKRHKKLVNIITSEYKNNNSSIYNSLEMFYRDIYYLYYGKKIGEPAKKTPAKRLSVTVLITLVSAIFVIIITYFVIFALTYSTPSPALPMSTPGTSKPIEFDL